MTLPSSTRPDDSDPEQEHSVDSMEAGRERLDYSSSGSRGQFCTQGTPGTSGDEDEAQEIPHRSNAPKSKARLEGQVKEATENTTKGVVRRKMKGGELEDERIPAPVASIAAQPGQTNSRLWKF
ncbi:hypothetical protein DFH09DRAFT_1101470 [Mycena vulgaris]|nr:hypothetical protein DFH09DRAFT_1101470 [Mycena vulgaris]